MDRGNTETYLAVQNRTMYQGGTHAVPVEMTNTKLITAFEFLVTLPTGFTLKDVEQTDRMGSDHMASFSQQTSGAYKVVAYSASSQTFNGTSGALVNLILEVDETLAKGNYTMNVGHIELTTRQTEAITPSDISATLTVDDVLTGDANGDGRVSITDVVCIVNQILGEMPATFVSAAADINGMGTSMYSM